MVTSVLAARYVAHRVLKLIVDFFSMKDSVATLSLTPGSLAQCDDATASEIKVNRHPRSLGHEIFYVVLVAIISKRGNGLVKTSHCALSVKNQRLLYDR